MENVEIDKVADVIYDAPFVVMAHNRFSEGVKDSEAVFTYGNKVCICHLTAQRRFGSISLLSGSTRSSVSKERIVKLAFCVTSEP